MLLQRTLTALVLAPLVILIILLFADTACSRWSQPRFWPPCGNGRSSAA
jgi:hypothetical protein